MTLSSCGPAPGSLKPQAHDPVTLIPPNPSKKTGRHSIFEPHHPHASSIIIPTPQSCLMQSSSPCLYHASCRHHHPHASIMPHAVIIIPMPLSCLCSHASSFPCLMNHASCSHHHPHASIMPHADIIIPMPLSCLMQSCLIVLMPHAIMPHRSHASCNHASCSHASSFSCLIVLMPYRSHASSFSCLMPHHPITPLAPHPYLPDTPMTPLAPHPYLPATPITTLAPHPYLPATPITPLAPHPYIQATVMGIQAGPHLNGPRHARTSWTQACSHLKQGCQWCDVADGTHHHLVVRENVAYAIPGGGGGTMRCGVVHN